jgi:hypothetical protein
MVLDFAQLRQLVELMRPGAPQLAVASRAQAAEAKPGSSNEAIAIWTTMAIRPLTCLPKGVLSYGLTTEGEVAMIRPPTKEEAFLTEPTDKAARRWAKLEIEFKSHEVEPQFLAVPDSIGKFHLLLFPHQVPGRRHRRPVDSTQ